MATNTKTVKIPADPHELAVPHWSQYAYDARREVHDCWAACIKMAVVYWRGVEYRTDALAALVEGDTGAPFLDIYEVLAAKGIAVSRQRLEAATAAQEIAQKIAVGLPVLLYFWTPPHLVVVRGVRAQGLIINDPALATGGRLLAWAEFERRALGTEGWGYAIVAHGRKSYREVLRATAPTLHVRGEASIRAAIWGGLWRGEQVTVTDVRWGDGYTWRRVEQAEHPGLVGGWCAARWLTDV